MSERREWWISPDMGVMWNRHPGGKYPPKVIHVREVLPGDDVPQEKWTEVVIELQQMREENERLRRLLKRCQPYVEAGTSECDTQLCDEVEKEVGMISCRQNSSCCVKKEKEVGDE